jgi:TP901 family phage tail tape measure protein
MAIIPIVSTFDPKGVKSLLGSFKQIVSSADTTSKKIKLGMQVGAAGALGAVGGIGAGLLAVGSTFDEAYDKIRIQTGKTGPALQSLENDMKAVATSVPASFGDASTAIGEFNSRLGLTGKPLQDLSAQTLELSRITNTDLGSNIQAVSGVMTNFGIQAGNQTSALDTLFRASQQSGVSVGDLANQMAGAGVQLRDVGLTFDQSAALLATLGKAGLNVGDVMPALGKAMAVAAKQGKDASSIFKDSFNAIKNAPDSTSAAGIAMDTFGAKAGPKLAAMIREGKLSFEDMQKSIAKGDGIMKASSDTQDFGEKLTTLKNQVFVALEPIATGVFNAIGMAMDKIGPILKKVTEYFKTHKGVLIAVSAVIGGILLSVIAAYIIQMGLAAVATIAATLPILLIIVGIGLLVAAIILLVEHWHSIWGSIKDAALAAWQFLDNNVIHPIVSAFTTAWQSIQDAFMSVWNWISGNWPLLLGIITGPIGLAVYFITKYWDDIVGFFKTAVGAIGDVFAGIADAILFPFKMAFNGIAAIWNNTVGKLRFEIPSWVPLIGGKGFDVPQIPYMAKGGSVMGNSPYIVGEQGPELFVPSSSGSIIPNNRMGGSVVNHITINATSADPQAVVNALRKYMQSNGTLAGAGIK